MFHVPINQEVPLWQAQRIGARRGPAVLQVQDDVWVFPLQESHLNIHWFPEHFSDWVVFWSVVGAKCCYLYNENSAVLADGKNSPPAGIAGSEAPTLHTSFQVTSSVA